MTTYRIGESIGGWWFQCHRCPHHTSALKTRAAAEAAAEIHEKTHAPKEQR